MTHGSTQGTHSESKIMSTTSKIVPIRIWGHREMTRPRLFEINWSLIYAFNSALFLIDPIPSIWSKRDLLKPFFLLTLCALTANLCASSLILWRKNRVGSFLSNLNSLPLWKKVSFPLFLNFPLAIATIGKSWRPSSFKVSRATEYWPFPPSIRTKSGKLS